MVVAQEKIQWQEPREEVSFSPKLPKRRKKTGASKSILLLILAIGVAGTISIETINLTVAKGAEIRALEKEINNIKAQNDLLQVQVDKLRSVNRIEKAALDMGMEKPAGTVYVTGSVPSVKNQTGVPSQTAKQPAEQKPSTVKTISQLFTSFFASTQR